VVFIMLIFFIVTANFVLLGTLYPLAADAFGMGKISVGEPWFNLFFTKIMAVVALMLGLGSMLNWKKTDFSKIKYWQLVPFLLSCWIGSVIPGLLPGEYSIVAAISIALGSWVILSSLADVWRRSGNTASRTDGLMRLSKSYYGMIIAHIGFALSLLGASLNTVYSDQRDVRLTIGKPLMAAGYEYELADVVQKRGPNFTADEGEVVVRRDGKELFRLYPQKRRYKSGGSIMTEAAIDAGFMRDIYVALGDKLSNTDWAIRIHYKPVVRWIWLGAIFMALGGGIAIRDKRYKLAQAKQKKAAESNKPDNTKDKEKPLDGVIGVNEVPVK